MSSGLLTRGRPGADHADSADRSASIDPRLRARRIEVARDHGRRRLRRIAVLGLVTTVVLGAVGASRSGLLDVDRVTVRGASRSGGERIREAAGIDRGRAMTSVDLGAAEARLAALPWVAEAEVSRRWPGTVEVRVVERTPVAIAGIGPGAVLLDRAGRILGPATAADSERLPVGGPDPVEGPGERVPASRRPVLPMLADLEPVLLAEVARGTVGPSGLGLVLRDGIRVDLGDGTRLRAKADAVLVLLAQADRSSIRTIDVAVPDAAAVTRTAPSDPSSALTDGEEGGA